MICANGQVLTVGTIHGLRGRYRFVYVNACGAAQAGPDTSSAEFSLQHGAQVIEGLAIAFIEGGAEIFISPLWKIREQSADQFASTFYDLVLGPDHASFGEALRWMREEWPKRNPQDPTWAGYVLYGSPVLSFESLGRGDATLRGVHQGVRIPSAAPFEQQHVMASAPVAFLREIIPDERITLDPTGERALQETLDWVTQMRWDLVARFDLLVGLARVPDGLVARGLAAQGISVDDLSEFNTRTFGRSHYENIETFRRTHGVASAVRRAAEIALRDGRTAIGEADLAVALLEPHMTGSLEVALIHFGTNNTDLLAAGRGAGPVDQPQPVLPFSLLNMPQREHGNDKPDSTPRHVLDDLKGEIGRARERGSAPPFVGRQRAVDDVLAILTRAREPHVVVHGPPGVGARALAYEVATRVVTNPTALEVARLASWELYAVRPRRLTERVPEWLLRDIQSLGWPTLLLFEDLPGLLRFDGVDAILRDALHHVHLRVLAAAESAGWRQVQREHRAIADALTPIELEVPRPEEALAMVRAHVPALEGWYGVTLAPEAVTAAMELALSERPLVLPGAALERLERAVARKVGRPMDRLERSERGAEAPSLPPAVSSPAPAGAHTTAIDPLMQTGPAGDYRPLVTPDDVRTATPESSVS